MASDSEWFQGRSINEDKTVTRWRFVVDIAAILSLAGTVIWATKAHAEPVYQVSEGATVITLYDEPCALDSIKNLPYKAEWREGGQVFSGCWGPWQNQQAVIGYFSDKTVAVIPFQVLKKVQGA